MSADLQSDLIGQWVTGSYWYDAGTERHPKRERRVVTGPIRALTFERGRFVALIQVRRNAHDYDNPETATISGWSLAKPW